MCGIQVAMSWTLEPFQTDPGNDSPVRGLSLGWWLLIGLVVFSPLIEGGTTHTAVTVIRLIVLGCLAWTWVMACRTGQVAIPSLPVAPVVWSFLGVALVSTLSSSYRHQSTQWLIVLCTYAVLLYLLVSFLTTWEHVRRICVVVLLLGMVEAGLGVSQYLWRGVARANGTFFNPNFLAGYLTAVAVFLVGWVCAHRVRRAPILWIGGAAVLSLLTAACLMAGSRGAMLALAAGILVVFVLRDRTRGALAAGALILCLLMVPNPLIERLQAEHRANALSYARAQIWAGSVQTMLEHPMGVGLGLYQYVYPLHPADMEGQIARYGRMAQNAHNEYLQIGVELGWPGLLMFLWGIVLIGRETVTLLRQRLRRRHRGVVIGAFGATVSLLVHAGVDANLHEPALAILLALLVALLLSARQWTNGCTRPWATWTLSFPNHRLAMGVAGIGLIGMVGFSVTGIGVAWGAHEAGSQAAARQDYPRAVEGYERAIAWDPGKALYHSSLGAAHYQTFVRTGQSSEVERALAELKTAIALNPLDGRLPALLGNLCATIAKTQGSGGTPTAEGGSALPKDQAAWRQAAIVAYGEALKREPYSPFYRLEVARLHVAEQDYIRAETWLRELLALEPNFLPGRALLAEVLMAQGRDQAARDLCRDIVARQQRFAQRTKDSLERQYLDVDTVRLAAEVGLEVTRL